MLWLLSSDVGDSRVAQIDGEWTKDWDWATLPPDIEKSTKAAGQHSAGSGHRDSTVREAVQGTPAVNAKTFRRDIDGLAAAATDPHAR